MTENYLLGNEKWEQKLESPIASFAWGLVTDVQEGRTSFLAILTSPAEITTEQFETLDLSVMDGCEFKKATLDGNTFYLAQIGMNNKLYDLVMRCPFWSNKDGTKLYVDEKTKTTTLGKGGMSLGVTLSQTARNFMDAVIKRRAVPSMILSQRALLYFGASNPKQQSAEEKARKEREERQDIIDRCRFDPNGPYFVVINSNATQVPIQHYKGIFSLIEDRDLAASEYMACPFNLIDEVFGPNMLSDEGNMKFVENQMRNTIGVVDISFRYHVGLDPKVFIPDEKIFALRWGTRRIIITAVLEKPHEPMIPPPIMSLGEGVLASFNCSEKTLALVHKREAPADADGRDAKRLCLPPPPEDAAPIAKTD